GIDDAKISVIPNAVNRDLFRPGDRAAARADLGIAPDVRLVVCVAMLVYGKGQHLLLNAVTRLRMKYPDLRLALVGAPSHEPRYPQLLQKLIAQGGLAEVVNLPGPQSPQHVVKWLQAADLFALPSFDEGCCNAVLEAMACGVPVVTTPVGDNAVLVDAPRRGLLVPIDDAGALAAGLGAALGRAWDRAEIARHPQGDSSDAGGR